MKKNPVLKVNKPKEPPGRTRYLSKEEIKALLTECKNSENPYLFTIVLIALQTGMRKGEISIFKDGKISTLYVTQLIYAIPRMALYVQSL